MIRRRGTAIAGVAVVATLALAACDGGGSGADGPSGATQTSVGSPTTTSPQSTSPSTSPVTTTQPPAEPVTITMAMSGDILLHEGLWYTAQDDAERTGRGPMDFRPILSDMRPVISGVDFAICHMETPLAPKGGPFSGYPSFSVPPAILPAVKWLGYDACTTASNHSLDQGWDGLKRTIDDFDRIGLPHFGTVATEAASKRALIVNVKGVPVGLISATYGTNGIPLPAEEPWSVPLINTAKILRMAHQARLDGAKIVIVALHWGLEYDHEPISDQTTVADALTKSPDITFVYGHHAHVVQPYGKVNGKWVVYGLGNAIAQQDTQVSGVYDGNTARVTFGEQPDGSFTVTKLEYIPTMITPYDSANPTAHPMRWLDVPKALEDPAYASLHADLLATQARVRADINLLGAFKHGVTEGS